MSQRVAAVAGSCASSPNSFLGWLEKIMVPERGLEPPLPCENCDLNAARLPIPPLGHKCLEEDPGHAEVANNEALFILPAASLFVNATAGGLCRAARPE